MVEFSRTRYERRYDAEDLKKQFPTVLGKFERRHLVPLTDGILTEYLRCLNRRQRLTEMSDFKPLERSFYIDPQIYLAVVGGRALLLHVLRDSIGHITGEGTVFAGSGLCIKGTDEDKPGVDRVLNDLGAFCAQIDIRHRIRSVSEEFLVLEKERERTHGSISNSYDWEVIQFYLALLKSPDFPQEIRKKR